MRRLLAASEARQLGRGGVSVVSRACGLSRVTITKGLHELDEAPWPPGRVRRVGGGRWMLELGDPELPERLEALVEPLTRGDPESSLRWTIKSTRVLAAELPADGHPFSHETVAQLYGIYDVGRNTGFVNVGTDHDTGAFAVASLVSREPQGFGRRNRDRAPHARRLARGVELCDPSAHVIVKVQ